MHTLRELKSLDTIIFNNNIRIMLKAKLDALSAEKEILLPMKPILNEGVLKVEDYSLTERLFVYFRHERVESLKYDIYFEHYLYNHHESTFAFVGSSKLIVPSGGDESRMQSVQYAIISWGEALKGYSEAEQQNHVAFYANVCTAVFCYLSYLSLKSVIKERSASMPKLPGPSVNGSNQPTKRSEITIEGVRFITERPEEIINCVKRSIIRRTDNWTVRGHYRHLKSGREVFVHSYTKEKSEAEKTNPKIYRI